MRLLIVGASGQIARSLLEVLPNARQDLVLRALGRPHLDLARADTIKAALDEVCPDIVINTAAFTAVDRAETEARQAFAINCDGAARLAEQCALRDIPLVHFSTDYVFDGSKEAPYTEADPVSPLNVYGRSKLAGERRVQALCRKHVIVRIAWVYSPFGHNFVKTMLRLARQKDEVRIVHDQWGSPTYALHIASAMKRIIARLIECQGTQGADGLWGIYHMAGSGHASWHELAAEVFRVSRMLGGAWAHAVPIPTTEYPTPATRPANTRLDSSKLERTFGVRLPPWQEGVAHCVRQLLKGEA